MIDTRVSEPRAAEPDLVAPVDEEKAAPVDGFERTEAADVERGSLGDSGSIEAGLDTGLGDRTERFGDLAERDPMAGAELVEDVDGIDSGSPESTREAGRGTAGTDTGPTPTPYPGGGGGVKVGDAPSSDGGGARSQGDEAGPLKGVAKNLIGRNVPLENRFKMVVGDEGSIDPSGLDADGGDTPSEVETAPEETISGEDQIEPGAGGGSGPLIPIGFDPDDVVDAPDNDLDRDDGVTDPFDDPVGEAVAGGPEIDHSIHYDLDPDGIVTDESMLPDSLSPDRGDIDFGDF